MICLQETAEREVIMNSKTISLTGSEVKVEFYGTNAWLRNDGTSTVYAGKSPSVAAGADGVVSVPAGGSAPVFDAHGTVYLTGTGSVLLIGSDYSENPFKSSAQGGSGADEVARAAIEAHAGNSALHLTAEQLDNAVSEVKSYADTKDAETLTAAKAYADGLAMSGGDVTQSYVDGKDAETLAGAQSYADSAAQSAVASANAFTEQYSAKFAHTHTVSDLTDFTEGVIEEQLAAAISNHNTDSAAHTGLFAGSQHTHTVSEITDFPEIPESPAPTAFSVATSSWTTLSEQVAGRGFSAEITAESVTAADFPDVYFDSASFETAANSGIIAGTADGKIVFYAKTVPEAALSGTYFVRKGAAE